MAFVEGQQLRKQRNGIVFCEVINESSEYLSWREVEVWELEALGNTWWRIFQGLGLYC